MTTTLPAGVIDEWVEFRVFASDGWANGSSWTAVTMWDDDTGPGVRVASVSRRALPQWGEAVIEAPCGIYDQEAQNIVFGNDTNGTWSQTYSYINPPELLRQVIRIQARQKVPPGDSPNSWTTVFLGVCLWQDDDFQAAGTEPIGLRRYRCVDLLYSYLSNYDLTSHAFAPNSGRVHDNCYGHPGYNIQSGDAVLGNKSSTETTTVAGQTVDVFALPGSTYAETFTDQEVVEHAMLSRRVSGDPVFAVRSAAASGTWATTVPALQGSSPWPVSDTAFAWEIVTQILRRQRGVGAAYFDWPTDGDTGSTPSAINNLYVSITPQTFSGLTSGTTTIIGAFEAQTYVEVDLIGDHRYVDGSYALDTRDEIRVDYLETVGEPIEVAVTVAYEDSTLEAGWNNGADYYAADSGQRSGAEYALTYNRHNLANATNFFGKAADGNGGTAAAWTYEVTDAGEIATVATNEFSFATIQVMPDRPMLEGIDYSTDPPSPFASLPDAQRRMPPLVLIRSASDRYVDVAPRLAMKIAGEIGLHITSAGDENGSGYSVRYIGETSYGESDTVYDYTQIVMTIGIQLGNRLRVATGDATSYRRRRIYLPNHHLWLAQDGCIWSLDDSTTTDGAKAGQRISDEDGYKVLRSDLAALKLKHDLAWLWYGSEHNALTYQLRCCGLLRNYRVAAGGNAFAFKPGSIDYPRVGEYLYRVDARGTTAIAVGSVITSIEYDNNAGITTWSTDWTELDV